MAEHDEALVERAAEALFRWNTPDDPYFVIHGRVGDTSEGDPYVPIARAALDAVADEIGRSAYARGVQAACERGWLVALAMSPYRADRIEATP